MALVKTTVDYTDKDFDALRARLINLVRGAFPEWTDFNVADFGNILLEMFAFVGDTLLYYQDNQAGESRISTARLRKSLIGISKLIGFVPTGATASTLELTATLAASPVGSVTFEVGDTFRTQEITSPVVFHLLAEVVIAAGAPTPIALLQVENSALASDVYSSTTLANQEMRLTKSPYLDGSLVVTAGDGVYTHVENFLSSASTDRHFTVVVDENDRATVRFGNGIAGSVPVGSITFDYKTGGGTTGNVAAGTVVKADKTYYDSFGNPQTLSVTNLAGTSNGSDRQSVESIRLAAPESARIITATVGREDYEINAKRVPGVTRALMLTSDQFAGIPENSGVLRIIPNGGGLPSSALKADVLTMVTVTYPNHLTFTLSVVDPDYLTIDVQATVFLSSGQTPSIVDARIRSALADFFALNLSDGSPNQLIDFGFNFKDASGNPDGTIAWSDVFNVVRDTSGVRKMGDGLGDFLLNGERSDVIIGNEKFPVLGGVVLLNGETGTVLA